MSGTRTRIKARQSIGVGMIGTKFMGKAHSNAWSSAGQFFKLPRALKMHVIAGRNASETASFALQWGWEHATTDWKELLNDPDVDLVDVCTPNNLHAEMSIEALAAGKHVACEKPLAGTLEDARKMKKAAQAAKRKGIQTFVWFNYRRVPAVAFAHQLVKKGKLGRIFHVRANYLQDWGHGDTPLVWRFDASQAGSGAHGDLNAHIIDATRFITGDEITEVSGAIEKTFIEERAIPGSPSRGKRKARTMKSTVDDCVLFLARFKGGAVASYEATRLATGNQNRNTIEINGEKGAIRFDFERMNELQWWDNTLPSAMQGWSRIMCTNANDHPYIDAYWPPAHGLGYEHGFVSQSADIAKVISRRKPVVALPDFSDAYETQRVLEAAVISARTGSRVLISKVR
mgnify:CR=1 FL=1